MALEFKLPDTGEGIHEAEILEILVAEGDMVEEGQNVFVVETDKASLELPSPESGVIGKIQVSVGDTVTVGDTLITFAEREESDAGEKRPEPKSRDDHSEGEEETPDRTERRAENIETENVEGREHQVPARPDVEDDESRRRGGEPTSSESDETAKAAPTEKATEEEAEGRPVKSVPATRRLAKELGVDLGSVTPTGRGGRVTDEDVRQAAGGNGTGRRRSRAFPDFERWGEVERTPLRSIRRAVSERMAAAWREVPHVTHVDSVAIDPLEDLRRRHATADGEKYGKLTLTALVVKAVAAALKDHPRFNASLDSEKGEIVLKRYCNIGVAVDTERGLIVPVVHDADRKSALEIGRNLIELAEAARNGKISREQLSGGSFTITNVGPLGGRAFTPIINWPEAAILGVGKAQLEPVAQRDSTGGITFVPRLMLPLCLAFDHRLNDGADAARFMARLMQILSSPEEFALAA